MPNIDPPAPVPPEITPAVETAPTVAASPAVELQPEPSVKQPPAEPTASQQMAEGLGQFAAGAKNFLQNTARPAVVSAASAAKEKADEAIKNHQAASPSGNTRGRTIAALVLPVAAFTMLLALFLPAATVSMFGASQSITVFQGFEEAETGAGGGAVAMLLFWLVVTIVGVLVHKSWIRIGNGILAIAAGLLFGSTGFRVLGGLGGWSSNSMGMNANPGIGVVLIILASAVAVAAGVALLIPARAAGHSTSPAQEAVQSTTPL